MAPNALLIPQGVELKTNNPITRLFKPKLATRSVNLNTSSESLPLPSATCEVIEYDSTTGMEQWNDSVFMQDFEDSTLTAPAPLFVESPPANPPPVDMIDIFSNVGNKSA